MKQVMGILNVTPDSFSDGGRHDDTAGAIAFGRAMIAAGADIVDVGGESTRPGSDPVGEAAELERVLPVVEALAGDVTVSIDTRHGSVARQAVAKGASIINDISASLHEVAAELGVGWVAMHMLGAPKTMQENPSYHDVVAEVLDYLVAKANRAVADGVERVWIDPGIGFGKTTEHNVQLMRQVGRFAGAGHPLVIGVSRKRFLGELLAASDGVEQVGTDDRLEGSVSLAAWSYAQGADIVRVHDVAATVAVRDSLSAQKHSQN